MQSQLGGGQRPSVHNRAAAAITRGSNGDLYTARESKPRVYVSAITPDASLRAGRAFLLQSQREEQWGSR